jgi:hypothetical protein
MNFGKEFCTMLKELGQVIEALRKLESAKLKAEQLDAVIAARTAVLAAFNGIDDLVAQKDAMASELRELRSRLEALDAWREVEGRYNLVKTDFGGFVYTQAADDDPEPPHFLCAHCFEGKRRSILQPTGQSNRQNGSDRWFAEYKCNSCEATVSFGQVALREHKVVRTAKPRSWGNL